MDGHIEDNEQPTGQKESTLEWVEQHNRRVKLLRELEHADLPDCNCTEHEVINEHRT
jgi:hypothetical protein